MFRVTADIRYLDGALADLEIPAGFACSYPTRQSAVRASQWLQTVQRTNDFIRATGTGHRYVVTGGVTVDRI